jgi:sec-independent protein translocase protein TatB
MVLLFLGDIGGSELLLIAVVALLVLGPQRLPDLMRKVGSVLGQFRRASTDLQRQLNNELRDAVDPKAAPGGPSFGTQAAAWVSRLKADVKGTLEEPAPTLPPAAAPPAAAPAVLADDIEVSELASAPDVAPAPTPPPPEADRG